MVSIVTGAILNTSVLRLQHSVFSPCKPTFGSSCPHSSGNRSSQSACLHVSGAGCSWAVKTQGCSPTSRNPVVTEQPVGCPAPDCYWQSTSPPIKVSCETQRCSFLSCVQAMFFTAVLLYTHFGYIKSHVAGQIPSTKMGLLLKKASFCTPSKRSF